ncbi:MAG: hypothetical protein ALECFALPRED_007154 [Alectoria fallacina]|uniref:N-acetyltransferase domain-containing protein n=1 Tax=Alectoria fallacina TaxID=1903189 RepID=A0A8H3J073_9LECA|nr:MAG: hypothetical protein ALECFALPRED_007154 [Alectoria fallacina]
MHRPRSIAISLLPASEDDIPSLIRVHMTAFAYDNSARLMFKDKDEYETALLDMLKAQLSNPKIAVIKAISKDTGNVLGWQASRFLGEDDDLGAVAGVEEVEDETKDRKENTPTLRSVIRKDSVRVQQDWMANREYIHFTTLVVDPAAQGHGVGTALVRWVTDNADEHGIYCWLQSSQAAHGIYLKAGFKDVGSFEVDLREFAPGGKRGGWGWGLYKYRYMLRLPGS